LQERERSCHALLAHPEPRCDRARLVRVVAGARALEHAQDGLAPGLVERDRPRRLRGAMTRVQRRHAFDRDQGRDQVRHSARGDVDQLQELGQARLAAIREPAPDRKARQPAAQRQLCDRRLAADLPQPGTHREPAVAAPQLAVGRELSERGRDVDAHQARGTQGFLRAGIAAAVLPIGHRVAAIPEPPGECVLRARPAQRAEQLPSSELHVAQIGTEPSCHADRVF